MKILGLNVWKLKKEDQSCGETETEMAAAGEMVFLATAKAFNEVQELLLTEKGQSSATFTGKLKALTCVNEQDEGFETPEYDSNSPGQILEDGVVRD